MRKPTGPGKIDESGPPSLTLRDRFGLLYNFDIDDSSLKKEHRDWLEQVAAPIASCQAAEVFLKGSASRSGGNEYNLQLSNRRAASVRKYLVDLGVAPAKLDTVGYGENRPVAEGHNEEAWAQNRRVEFRH